MKFYKEILATIICGLLLSLPVSAWAQCTQCFKRDREAIASYLNSKRTIDYAEKHKTMIISGDIRGQWLHRTEFHNGIPLRGRGAKDSRGLPVPIDTYEAVLNLRFDLKCERWWATGYLQFDNGMGVGDFCSSCVTNKQGCFGSGEGDDICLKRAYAGYRLIDKEGVRLDVEVGRRPMYTIFDSRIEFHARFDGLLFKLSDKIKGKGEYYLNGGPFIVDYRVNHYPYVFETGVYDFFDSGFDIKYSYIDWKNTGKNRCNIPNARGWRFRNSQWSLAYNFKQTLIPKKMRAYGAFLLNHAAERIPRFIDGKPVVANTNDKLANVGWYLGFIIGEVKKRNDWSLDVNYQVVQAQAVPECDLHGVGRGNVRRESFTINGRGKGNYEGWHFEGLYAITDKLSLDALVEVARAYDISIGGRHHYKKYEVDLIYQF